jgi:hypothetical protein
MFSNFISLRCFCGTAASMSKYGLRELSEPFDWCFSELEGVLHMINTDFEQFLDIKNISIDNRNNKIIL